MKKNRDPNSGALIFTRTPEEENRKKLDKYIEDIIKDNVSLNKKLKLLMSKYKDLEKRVKGMEDKGMINAS